LCLILDEDLLPVEPAQAMTEALAAGVRFFQYRSKTRSRRHIYEQAQKIAEMAKRSEALFIVNDHADIAIAVGADGVHLGQDDLPIEAARKLVGSGTILGISTHSSKEARDAERAGADYIGFGPIFSTTTKDAGMTQGTAGLAAIRQIISIPVIAIGGIDHKRVGDVMKAGADGVAVISAIISAPDRKQAAEQMIRNIQKA